MSTLRLDMATAFLVSPCYVLTNYHVVFGNRKSGPEAGRDYSATFWAGGKKSRAIPVKHGQFHEVYWQDWALLQLEPDGEQRCIGEDPNIGWARLAPLPSEVAPNKVLSTAGYPSDKPGPSLWRQDACHLFEEQDGRQYSGLWTTNCATRPRASGSPIFFVQDGGLMVTALMQGHLGYVDGNEILPKWDPKRANLAVDIGKIISSDGDILKLIAEDIDRYRQIGAAQTVSTDANQIEMPGNSPEAQSGDVSGVAPASPSDHIQVMQPEPSRGGSGQEL
jgi:V8-like Glu-specific endopeptidase